eukprot:CAMPEP_0194069384 /NCGR_PEP_ID=MMETSP0009_2-20130614/87609_1 /TAXON_ID=210454 /ORGANISM="Grammatophora oceanica, Strain CCMP 410" /LENGTH=535 /DNA_ID=CAMNT_0038722563 /DNA_START=1162 /DNA_END=2769 /DNA_ORIENTATION=+
MTNILLQMAEELHKAKLRREGKLPPKTEKKQRSRSNTPMKKRPSGNWTKKTETSTSSMRSRGSNSASRGSNSGGSKQGGQKWVKQGGGPPPSQITVDPATEAVTAAMAAATVTTAAETLDTENSQEHAPLANSKVAEAIENAMDNDALTDITLQGKNGCLVRAAKYPIACRNEGLMSKLYEDANAEVVYIGDYNSIAIKALIEYCHTGLTERHLGSPTIESARGLVELAALAQDYEFEALYVEAYQASQRLVEQDPRLACAIYDAETTSSDLESNALQTIQQQPDEALVMGMVPGISHVKRIERMEKLLSNLEMEDDETLIHILHTWVEGNQRDPTKLRFARAQTQHVALEHLATNFLKRDCKNSGFFDALVIDHIVASRSTVGVARPGSYNKSVVSYGAASPMMQQMQAPLGHPAAVAPLGDPTVRTPEQDEQQFVYPTVPSSAASIQTARSTRSDNDTIGKKSKKSKKDKKSKKEKKAKKAAKHAEWPAATGHQYDQQQLQQAHQLAAMQQQLQQQQHMQQTGDMNGSYDFGR